MAEPLVFVPGMMCDARVFLPQIVAFSIAHPVQVASLTAGDTVEEMAQSLLDAAPPRFALAGLSMGGIVAMEVMRRAPERLTRVALISTTAQAESPAQAADREPQIVQARSGRMQEAVRLAMPPDCLAPGDDRDRVLGIVDHMAKGMGPEVFTSQSRALQRRPDQQKTLRTTRIPAFVICGRHDSLTPVKRHRFMAELIPHAQLRIIEGAGHLPTLESAADTSSALCEWMSAPFLLCEQLIQESMMFRRASA